jgi:hypothetical protein
MQYAMFDERNDLGTSLSEFDKDVIEKGDLKRMDDFAGSPIFLLIPA